MCVVVSPWPWGRSHLLASGLASGGPGLLTLSSLNGGSRLYVESGANIADLPSRGDLALTARLLRERFERPVWVRHLSLPPLRPV